MKWTQSCHPTSAQGRWHPGPSAPFSSQQPRSRYLSPREGGRELQTLEGQDLWREGAGWGLPFSLPGPVRLSTCCLPSHHQPSYAGAPAVLPPSPPPSQTPQSVPEF